jgi:hypothetical protein
LTEPSQRAKIVLHSLEVIMLPYVFVLFAVAARFLPHPWGFTPVAASLLFFSARGSRRHIWVPWMLLAASDVVLTKLVYAAPFFWDHLVTWGWYAAVLWLGTQLREKSNPVRIAVAALASSVSFFLVSNFAVWALQNLYPKNLGGLMLSYTLALPFFRRTLAGDLLFTAMMFVTPVVLHALATAVNKADHQAAA